MSGNRKLLLNLATVIIVLVLAFTVYKNILNRKQIEEKKQQLSEQKLDNNEQSALPLHNDKMPLELISHKDLIIKKFSIRNDGSKKIIMADCEIDSDNIINFFETLSHKKTFNIEELKMSNTFNTVKLNINYSVNL